MEKVETTSLQVSGLILLKLVIQQNTIQEGQGPVLLGQTGLVGYEDLPVFKIGVFWCVSKTNHRLDGTRLHLVD